MSQNKNEKTQSEITAGSKKIKRNTTAGVSFVIIGTVLFLLGMTISMTRGHSTIPFIALPLMLIGMIIWYNSVKLTQAESD